MHTQTHKHTQCLAHLMQLVLELEEGVVGVGRKRHSAQHGTHHEGTNQRGLNVTQRYETEGKTETKNRDEKFILTEGKKFGEEAVQRRKVS